VLHLDALEFLEQCVELGIGDQGLVLLIVGVPVLADVVREL
jgi:hypothetical protein